MQNSYKEFIPLSSHVTEETAVDRQILSELYEA